MTYKEIIKQLDKEEQAYERKQRRWCKVSLENLDYEGDWFTDNNTPAKEMELKESQEKVNGFLETLTPVQQRRLMYRLENTSISLREIARIEGVDIKTIRESFSSIENKFKKYFS